MLLLCTTNRFPFCLFSVECNLLKTQHSVLLPSLVLQHVIKVTTQQRKPEKYRKLLEVKSIQLNFDTTYIYAHCGYIIGMYTVIYTENIMRIFKFCIATLYDLHFYLLFLL